MIFWSQGWPNLLNVIQVRYSSATIIKIIKILKVNVCIAIKIVSEVRELC